MANSSNPFDFSEFRSPSGGPGLGADRGQVDRSGFPAASPRESSFDPFAADTGPSIFGDNGTAAPSFDGFGQSDPRGGMPVEDEAASPPVLWCSLAGLAALTAIALGVLGLESLVLAVSAWAIAGPVAIGLLAVHTMSDTKRRAEPFYSQPGWTAPVYWTVMIFAFAGVGLSAWSIADWVGRL